MTYDELYARLVFSLSVQMGGYQLLGKNLHYADPREDVNSNVYSVDVTDRQGHSFRLTLDGTGSPIGSMRSRIITVEAQRPVVVYIDVGLGQAFGHLASNPTEYMLYNEAQLVRTEVLTGRSVTREVAGELDSLWSSWSPPSTNVVKENIGGRVFVYVEWAGDFTHLILRDPVTGKILRDPVTGKILRDD